MSSSLYGGQGMGGGPLGYPSQKSSKLAGEKLPHGYSMGQVQQFDPQQMALYNQMFQHASPESFTSRLASGDQSMFEQMEAPAMRQFAGMQGNLASRFSGMGMGARKSSGFQNAMGAQASNFAQDLQAQRMGYQRQALQDLRGMSQELLGQRPYDRFAYKQSPKERFNWAGLAGGVAGGLVGGPAGAMAGYSLGSSAHSAMGGGGSGGGGGFPGADLFSGMGQGGNAGSGWDLNAQLPIFGGV